LKKIRIGNFNRQRKKHAVHVLRRVKGGHQRGSARGRHGRGRIVGVGFSIVSCFYNQQIVGFVRHGVHA